MTGGGTLQNLVDGGRKAVDVAAIERELASLWRSASGGEAAAERDAVVRACLWNAVVHTVDGRAADDAQQDLAELSMELPSRALLIRTDPAAAGNDIQAWITTNCRLSGDGRRNVCCEEITLSARGKTMSELPALVRALLAPDVPSVLFWLEEPSLAGRHLADWMDTVDRFVFDSFRWTDAAELHCVLDSGAELARPPELGDLNWHRLAPWRLLAARVFDHPDLREALVSAERVVVEGEAGTQRMSMALFFGWWTTRLGLAPAPGSYADASGRKVALECAPGSGEGLVALRFESPGRWVELRRHGEQLIVRTAGLERHGPRPRTLAPPSGRARLWSEELTEYGSDPLLAAALPAAASLLE